MIPWLAILIASASPEAAPPRVGIFVGSNGAPDGRTPLSFAEEDARRMRRVFVELGGLAPENAHILEAPTADAILAIVRRFGSAAGMLVFYYSGHADERALLLERSELSFVELNRALESTGARLSLHLFDACRSGALTRRKGASLGERITVDAADGGEGRVVITSSAEWEDSHESDRLGGSFFTLHMATGLRGAADADRDGRVTLSEAYRYVYGRTLESTLGNSSGAQHPTFAYDLSGRGDLTLTWPTRSGGTLVFGNGDYLVVEARSGNVAAEVATRNARINLPSGEYRIRKWTRSEVLSGRVEMTDGLTVEADQLLTEREAHARLVRKGTPAGPRLAQSVRVMGGVRGRVADGIGLAAMFRLGYELSLPWFSVMPFASVTTPSSFETPRLTYRTRELGLGLQVSRALDFPWITLRGALLAEGVNLAQSELSGRERHRATWGGAVAGQLGLESPPFLGDFVAAVVGEAAIYVYRTTEAALEPAGDGEIVTRPTYRLLLSMGYEF